MKKQLQAKVQGVFALLLASVIGVQAQNVIFETDFNSEQGWVAEGTTASSPLTSGSQTINYGGKDFTFDFTRCQVSPTGKAINECSTGYVDIGKNDNSNLEQVGTKTTQGFFRLPVFDKDVQITLARSSTTKTDRIIAIEYSLDEGLTWISDEEGRAPLFSSPSDDCALFHCPTKFTAGTPIRIAVHSNGGSLRLMWLQVKEYVADNTPPSLVSIVPEDGAVEISPSLRSISLEFDEPVKAGGDGNIYVMNGDATSMFTLTSGMLTYNQQHVTIPFPDDFFLTTNTLYYVVLEEGAIKDMANNNAAPITKTFTTKVTASNEKDILSFKINGQIGDEVINSADATVIITANHDVDLSSDLEPLISVSDYAIIENGYKDFSQGPQTYLVTAEDGTAKTWTVTINKIQLKQAELPVIYRGTDELSWKHIVADGWTKYLTSDDNVIKMNNLSFRCANINNTPAWVGVWFKPGANRISFRMRYGNATSNFRIKLIESEDGEEWTDVEVYTPSIETPSTETPDPTPMVSTNAAVMSLRSYPLKPTSQYVKWVYELRTNTSFYIDDVVIENAATDNTAPTLTSNQVQEYYVYSENTKSQIFLQFDEPLKVSNSLIGKTTSIKLGGVDLFESNILCLRDGCLVLTNLEALDAETNYTITIPGDALVDLANNPFAGATITFSPKDFETGIENGVLDATTIYVSNKVVYVTADVEKIEVIDLMGKTVKSEKNKSELSASELSGVYIVKCTLTNGSVKVVKVIL